MVAPGSADAVWRDLAAASLDGVGVLERDAFVYANEEFARAFGAESPEDVVGDSWRERYARDELDSLGEALRRARSGDPWQGTAVARRVDDRAARHQVSVRRTEGDVVLWVVRDLAGRGERDSSLYEAILENVTDCVYATDSDLRFTYVNSKLCETFGRSRSELLGTDGRTLFSDEVQAAMADSVREQVVSGAASGGQLRATLPTPDGDRAFEARYCLYPRPDGEFRGSVGVIRDVTEREERQRRLERRRDELATLDRISDLLLETVRGLVESERRAAVERTVCEHLADSDLYEFAWVGERELDGDRIRPRTSAGAGRGYLDAVTFNTGGTDPVARALGTAEVATVTTSGADEAAWRTEASARGFESVAAIPLYHEDVVYGVLVVNATRADGFTDRERAGFDVLGRTVGLAIHAANNRELLFADSVVEVAFHLGVDETVLGRTAAASDAELTLEGYVSSADRWLLYLDTAGAPVGDVVAAAEEQPGVVGARGVGDRGIDSRVELVLRSSSLLETLAAAGATVPNADADPDGVHLAIEAPGDADIRELVDLISDAHPDSRLRSSRRQDRGASAAEPPDGVLDSLTERQREAVEVAYRAGYYDWPRRSTAEDVAASLDITAATVHGHLRKAERAVLAGLLE